MLSYGTPEAAGISSNTVRRWVGALAELDSLNSVILLRHGKIIAEGYWEPYNAQTPHQLYSLSKSFTSVAIGLAASEEFLRLTDPITAYFPEFLTDDLDPRYKQMQLRHLLMMATGHAQDTLTALWNKDANWAKAFFQQVVRCEPGTSFVYNSGATYMLSAVLRRATGQNLTEFLAPRLLDPLEIRSRIWECCPDGIEIGAWGYHLTTNEIARFGQLLLQGGIWEGKPLIPAGYLAEATHFQIANTGELDWGQGYGYQFWRSQHNAYRGDGAFGQFALVMPDQDAVIAITSGLTNMQNILTRTWDILLPAFENQPLPENSTAERALAETLGNLRISMLGKDMEHPCVPGGMFRLADNRLGLKTLELGFTADRCRIGFNGEFLEAGFGFRCDNRIRWELPAPLPVAADACWQDVNTLEIALTYYSTPFRSRIRLVFTPGTVELTRRSNLLFHVEEWPTLRGEAAD